MSGTLPVATPAQLRTFVRDTARAHPATVAGILVLYLAATAAGLVIPRLIGDLVGAATGHLTVGTVDRTVTIVALCLVVQVALTRFAQLRALRLGEQVLAELRERFVDRALALPLATVEDAGAGDLVTRASRDIDALARSVRFAVPATVVAAVTGICTVAAALLVGVWVAAPIVIGVPAIWVTTRWYLSRSRTGYLRAGATYSDITGTVLETVDGARTVEAFGLARERAKALQAGVDESLTAEQFNTRSRMVFFGGTEFGYVVPLAAAVLIGGLLDAHGLASLAGVTAAVLYLQRLIDPLDQILGWLDELQAGGASLARVLGVARRPLEDSRMGQPPRDGSIRLADLRFHYVPGQDVLRGFDLEVADGERVALVGASGAGKTTVARVLAGLSSATGGQARVGGVDIDTVDRATLRRHVALVTQESHVFIGTVRHNLVMAAPETVTEQAIRSALGAVGALDWATALTAGLDTVVGSGGHLLTEAQAQQIALARVLLADPRVVVLDEATSQLDPRSGRALEQAMARVLHGRTVVAIAHRLFTAHDADRIAVAADGRVTEHGTHDELLEQGGAYAALWHAWSRG
jgi:ABC-type multidrug transport system fused ATPase/permease subunit